MRDMQRALLKMLVVYALLAACIPRPEIQVHSPLFCVVVEAHAEQGVALAGVMKRFADSENLTNSGRDEEPVFRNHANTLELVVTTYLGPLGSMITLYELQGDRDAALLGRLDAFVRSEVASRWQIRACSDVPDLDTPQRRETRS